jgi:hypothetical protein
LRLTPLGSFSGFQPYKTANFKVTFPKTEVLGKPQGFVKKMKKKIDFPARPCNAELLWIFNPYGPNRLLANIHEN